MVRRDQDGGHRSESRLQRFPFFAFSHFLLHRDSIREGNRGILPLVLSSFTLKGEGRGEEEGWDPFSDRAETKSFDDSFDFEMNSFRIRTRLERWENWKIWSDWPWNGSMSATSQYCHVWYGTKRETFVCHERGWRKNDFLSYNLIFSLKNSIISLKELNCNSENFASLCIISYINLSKITVKNY